MKLAKLTRIIDKKLDLKLPDGARYSSIEHLAAFANAIDHNLSAEGSARILRKTHKSPQADTSLLLVKRQGIGHLEKADRRIRNHVLRNMKELGLLSERLDLALDYHEVPYYGEKKDLSHIVGKKPGKGTNWCYKIAIASVVVAGVRVVLGWIPVKKRMSDLDVVKRLLKISLRWIRVRRVLLDREFYSADIISFLDMKGLRYIMPARRSAAFEKRCEEGKNASFMHHVGRRKIRTRGVVVYNPIGKKKFHYYATNTNLSEEEVSKVYDRRWGVETGLRMIKEAVPKTCSNDFIIRYFYFTLGIALYNLWVLENALAGTETVLLAREPENWRRYVPAIRLYEIRIGLSDYLRSCLQPV